MAVIANHLESSGKLVLPVLDDPKPSAGVPVHVKRLLDFGFRGHEVHGKTGTGVKLAKRLFREGGGRAVTEGSASLVGFHDLAHLLVASSG